MGLRVIQLPQPAGQRHRVGAGAEPHLFCDYRFWVKPLSAEWLKSVSSKLGKVDSSLLEKAVWALFLAEQLKVNDLIFVFKGGTSLLLHLEKPLRFSIDVDIITPTKRRRW